MDLTVGSLDDPSAVRLTSHFGAESWVPRWIPYDDLPARRSDDHPALMARWVSANNAS